MEPWQLNVITNVEILTFQSSTISFSTLIYRHCLQVFTYRSWFDIREPTITIRIFYIDLSRYNVKRKLRNQGFIETRLRSTLKKCFYHRLTLPYRVSVTTMANDICRPWFCVTSTFYSLKPDWASVLIEVHVVLSFVSPYFM